MLERLLSAREVCALTGTSRATLWRRVRCGDLPRPVKFGRLARWPEHDLVGAIDRLRSRRDGADLDAAQAAGER